MGPTRKLSKKRHNAKVDNLMHTVEGVSSHTLPLAHPTLTEAGTRYTPHRQ